MNRTIMRADPSDSLGSILQSWERARKAPGRWRRTWRLPKLRWSTLARLPEVLRVRRHVGDVDYRDRASVATWMVVLSLGMSQLLVLPTAQIGFLAFGSPVTIPFTSTLLAALFAALMAAAGAESVVSVHPLMIERRAQKAPGTQTWSYWALPMAITMIAAVLLREAPSSFVQAVALLVSGGLLAAAYYGLYATIEPGRPGFRRARLWLDALAYGSALLLFLFVYQTRTRSLVSGSLVAVTAMLLAAEILRTTIDRPSLALTYGGVIGLILGQVTWALNYWVLPGLTGGLLLLLIFYLLVGIAQQGLQDRLTPRVLLEFGVFALIALILIALVGPGFSFTAGP